MHNWSMDGDRGKESNEGNEWRKELVNAGMQGMV